MPSFHDEDHYCGTCRRALYRHRDPSGPVVYYHPETVTRAATAAGEPDHDPNPVPLSKMVDPIMFCDFCSAPDPTWWFETANVVDRRYERSPHVISENVDGAPYTKRYGQAERFVSAREARRWDTPGAGTISTHLGERWTACEACAVLVEARDIMGLIWRVTQTLPAKMTRGHRLVQVRAQLTDTYTAVFAVLGPRTPLIIPGRRPR